jgi:lipoprotein-releasing system permease protein
LIVCHQRGERFCRHTQQTLRKPGIRWIFTRGRGGVQLPWADRVKRLLQLLRLRQAAPVIENDGDFHPAMKRISLWQTAPMLRELPFEWLVGLRYTRSGRRGPQRNRFISFISALSTVGIALGVMALIIVLSVMNGFQKEVRDRMLSVISHIEVSTIGAGLDDWQQVAQQVQKNAQVRGVAPFVAGQAMMVRGETLRGIVLRGVDPQLEGNVSDLPKNTRDGALAKLAAGEFNILLGSELAAQMGVAAGDKITLLAPEGSVTPVGVVPRPKVFTVAGVFESGHYEFDSAFAFVHLQDAARFMRVDGVSGLRVRIADIQQAPFVAGQLASQLPPDLLVRDWSSQNRVWFAAVQVEKRMMFIILALIIAVAAFNLVSMLVMTVTEKRGDIAILRTLGATPRSIQRIFMIQGSLIGFLGVLAGVALGTLIAYNIDTVMAGIEKLFNFQVLPKGIYLINRLPSDPRLSDISTIAVVAFVLAWFATLYPSWRAARTQPAEALRYE